MMLFSATYEETVMKFALKIISDPVTIRLKREEESLENIKQYYVLCSSKDEKFEALSNIYGALSIGQAIIFCHVNITYTSLQGIYFKHVRKRHHNPPSLPPPPSYSLQKKCVKKIVARCPLNKTKLLPVQVGK